MEKKEVHFTPEFKELEERRLAKYFEVAGNYAIDMESRLQVSIGSLEGFKAVLFQLSREFQPKLTHTFQYLLRLCEKEIRKEMNELRIDENADHNFYMRIVHKLLAFYQLILFLKENIGLGIRSKDLFISAQVRLKKALGISDPEELIGEEAFADLGLVKEFVDVILGEGWEEKYGFRRASNTEEDSEGL